MKERRYSAGGASIGRHGSTTARAFAESVVAAKVSGNTALLVAAKASQFSALGRQQEATALDNALAYVQQGTFSLFSDLALAPAMYRPLAIAMIVWESLQLLSFALSSSREFPWTNMPVVSPVATVLQVVCLNFYIPNTSGLSSVLFTTAVSLVCVALAMTAWLVFAMHPSRQEQRLTAHGPVRLLRWILLLVCHGAWMPAFTQILSVFRCTSTVKFLGWQTCWTAGHIALAVLCALLIPLFSALSFLTITIMFDRDGTSKDPLSRPHGRIIAGLLGLKAVMVFVFVLDLSITVWIHVICVAVVSGTTWYLYVVYLPYHWQLLNQLAATGSAITLWATAPLVLGIIQNNPGSNVAGYVLWFAMPAAAITGYTIANLQWHHWMNSPDYEITNVYQVELRARRMLDEPLGVTPELLERVDSLFAQAMRFFPNSSILHVFVAQYLAVYRRNRHLERGHLTALETSLGISLDEQFFIFHRRRCIQDDEQSDDRMHVLARFRIEKHKAQARELTLKARFLQLSFWTELVSKAPSADVLATTADELWQTMRQCEQHFDHLMRLSPGSVSVLRLYAQYLQEVANHPAKASALMVEAEEAEAAQTRSQHEDVDVVFCGTRDLLDMAAENVSVITISHDPQTLGNIIDANPACLQLFGYARRELLGKNIAVLMPEPLASAHDAWLMAYLSTGQGIMIGTTRTVFGLHNAGHIFPIAQSTRSTDEGFNAVQQGLSSSDSFLLVTVTDMKLTGACQRSFSTLHLATHVRKLKAGLISISSLMPTFGDLWATHRADVLSYQDAALRRLDRRDPMGLQVADLTLPHDITYHVPITPLGESDPDVPRRVASVRLQHVQLTGGVSFVVVKWKLDEPEVPTPTTINRQFALLQDMERDASHTPDSAAPVPASEPDRRSSVHRAHSNQVAPAPAPVPTSSPKPIVPTLHISSSTSAHSSAPDTSSARHVAMAAVVAAAAAAAPQLHAAASMQSMSDQDLLQDLGAPPPMRPTGSQFLLVDESGLRPGVMSSPVAADSPLLVPLPGTTAAQPPAQLDGAGTGVEDGSVTAVQTARSAMSARSGPTDVQSMSSRSGLSEQSTGIATKAPPAFAVMSPPPIDTSPPPTHLSTSPAPRGRVELAPIASHPPTTSSLRTGGHPRLGEQVPSRVAFSFEEGPHGTRSLASGDADSANPADSGTPDASPAVSPVAILGKGRQLINRGSTVDDASEGTGVSGSSSQVSTLRRRLETSTHRHPTVQSLDRTLLIILGLSLFCTVANYVTQSILMPIFLSSLTTLDHSSDRQVALHRGLTITEDLQLHADRLAILSADQLRVSHTNLLARLEEFESLHQEQYLSMPASNQLLVDLYSKNALVVSMVDAHGVVSSANVNLLTAGLEFVSRGRLAAELGADQFLLSNPSVFYIQKNGPGVLSRACNSSTQLAQTSNSDAFEYWQKSQEYGMILTSALFVFVSLVFILPALHRMESTKRDTFKTFLQVPMPVLRVLRHQVEVWIEAAQRVEDDSDTEAVGTGEQEQEGGIEALSEVLGSIKRQTNSSHGHEVRRFQFSLHSRWLIFLKVWIPMAMVLGAFLAMLWWVRTTSESMQLSSQEFLTSRKLEIKPYQLHNYLRVAAGSNNLTDAQAALARANVLITEISVAEHEVMFGSADLGTRSTLTYSPVAHLMLEDACVNMEGDGSNAACRAYYNGLFSSGLHAALSEYLRLSMQRATVLRRHFAGLSSFNRTASVSLLSASDSAECDTMIHSFLAAGLDRLVNFLQTEAETTATQFSTGLLVASICFILVLILLYAMFYRSMLSRLDLELGRARAMILLFPDEVVKNVPVVRDMVKLMASSA